MATTINLLDDLNGLYTQYSVDNAIPVSEIITDWETNSGVLSTVANEFVSKNRFTIRINPAGAGEFRVRLDNFPIRESDYDKTLSFNAKIKTGSACTIRVALNPSSNIEKPGNTQQIPGGTFAAVQSNTMEFSEFTPNATIDIYITGHNGQNVFITYPNLIDNEAFYENEFVRSFRNFMPDFYWEIDSQQEYPTAPMHRLIDAFTSAANEAYREYVAMFPYERAEIANPSDAATTEARSSLVDPIAVRTKYINWLSQFNGTAIKKDFSYSSIQQYFQTEEQRNEFVLWQLLSAGYGRTAGTRESLLEAARRVLIYTKDGNDSTLAVSLTPYYNGDPWSFLVRTVTNETLDADEGESSGLVLQAMEPARPMGYRLFHETVDSIEFTLNDLTFGRLTEIALGGATEPTDAPQNIVQDDVGTDYITLSFDSMSVPGSGDGGGIISTYIYYLSTDGGSSYDSGTTLSPAKGSPPITITGLSSSTNYYIKLVAVNEIGPGAVESAPFSFTTL